MSGSNEIQSVQRVEGTLMSVNSYLVDGPTGLVIVDGQLTVSDARAVRSVIDESGRPVAGMIVTHGHPDHYAGAATILDGLSAPIVATAGVADVISRDDAEKDEIVGAMMGAEWPTKRRFVDEVASPGEGVRLGGLEFSVRDLGPGESGDDSMWSVDEHTLFVGDVAYNDMHAYLLDGYFDQWLELLDQLDKTISEDAVLFVGHGAPTDRSVLGRQAAYVRAFVEAVAANLDVEQNERHDAVTRTISELVTDDRLSFLMELSIEPVAAVLRAQP